VDFFDRVSSGNTTLNQPGDGRRLAIILIDQYKCADNIKWYSLRAVIPAKQTTAPAKLELERKDINPANVVDML
jgi:hypothetical protein